MVGLREYRRKRRFERTPEPAGKTATGGRHRFVVQEHHASILHFDFRLELGGVLKSWSVPKGPSLDPAVKRLAVQVEDHPVDYLTFTGEIPEGNYGAGQVYQWDIGTFEPLDSDPMAALSRGALKFRLHGKKLKGEWRLVRMKVDRKPMWLLFTVKVAAQRVAEPREHRVQVMTLSDFLEAKDLRGDALVDVDGIPVALSHLDRIYWPREGITKHELLKYYIRIWPKIGPFLRDRPAILQRYPRGIEKPFFIQHHLESAPEFIRTQNSYAVYTTLASLLYLTNLGTIEHHPWHSPTDRLNRPDWLVLDLDPGQAPWENIIQVAEVLRKILEEQQFVSYVKTSGSKGLHIYIPLEPAFEYEDVSNLARDLAEEAARRAPQISTIERALALRKPAQVYIDWLQNARGKTLAAPYTARAVPGATVSMPIEWDEVPRVKISDFTIRSASGEAWRDFFEHRQKI